MWRLHVNARGNFAHMLSITDNLLKRDDVRFLKQEMASLFLQIVCYIQYVKDCDTKLIINFLWSTFLTVLRKIMIMNFYFLMRGILLFTLITPQTKLEQDLFSILRLDSFTKVYFFTRKYVLLIDYVKLYCNIVNAPPAEPQ